MWTCLKLAQPQLALRWQTQNINYMPKKCISGPNGEPARKWLKCFEKTQHSRFTYGKRLLWTLTKNSTPFVGTTKQCQSSMPLKEQCSKKEVHCMCEAATITTTKKITVCWEQTRERRVCHKQNNEEEKDTALDRTKEKKNEQESDALMNTHSKTCLPVLHQRNIWCWRQLDMHAVFEHFSRTWSDCNFSRTMRGSKFLGTMTHFAHSCCCFNGMQH